jgi:HSP20 family molecular chaperone IbpA
MFTLPSFSMFKDFDMGLAFKDIKSDLESLKTIAHKYHINESDSNHVLTVELPGIKKANVSVTTNKYSMNISVDKSSILQFELTADNDHDHITAKMEDGLLTITIPKTVPKNIVIQ